MPILFVQNEILNENHPAFIHNVVSNESKERVRAYVNKELFHSKKHRKNQSRSIDLSGNLLQQFSVLNLGNNSKHSDRKQLLPFSECLHATLIESNTSEAFDTDAFSCNLMKYISKNALAAGVTPNCLEFIEFGKIKSTEKCNVKFLYLLNENADKIDTIKMTLSNIANDLSINKQIKYLVVVGDGKFMIN